MCVEMRARKLVMMEILSVTGCVVVTTPGGTRPVNIFSQIPALSHVINPNTENVDVLSGVAKMGQN
jgi:hypothetical protein